MLRIKTILLMFMITMILALIPTSIQAQIEINPKGGFMAEPLVVSTFTNGIVSVEYDDTTGQYSFLTGAAHSFPGTRILFPVGTGYDSFRSLDSATDYTTGGFGTPLGAPDAMGATATTRTSVWDVNNAGDLWEIQQFIEITGTMEADTNARTTTTITNLDSDDAHVSVRHFWDYQVNGDDGPGYMPRTPDSPQVLTETDYLPPGHAFATIDDTLGDPTSTSAVADRTLQNREAYVEWPAVIGTSFDYAISGLNADDDSAVLFYWENITIPPGGSVSVDSSITPAAVISCPPVCPAVGGDMIQMETTSILAAGAQYTAAWMIPVIVSGIGIAIVIARKF